MIEYMVRNKKDVLVKINIISTIISLIIFSISLFLLIVSPYFLYGCLYGILALFISLLIINLAYKFISFKNNTYFLIFFAFFTRSIVLLIFLVILFLLINTGSSNSEFLFEPINFFIFLLIYFSYNISSLLVILF